MRRQKATATAGGVPTHRTAHSRRRQRHRTRPCRLLLLLLLLLAETLAIAAAVATAPAIRHPRRNLFVIRQLPIDVSAAVGIIGAAAAAIRCGPANGRRRRSTMPLLLLLLFLHPLLLLLLVGGIDPLRWNLRTRPSLARVMVAPKGLAVGVRRMHPFRRRSGSLFFLRLLLLFSDFRGAAKRGSTMTHAVRNL